MVSTRQYVFTFVALLTLTAIALATTRIHLGAWALPVALTIAALKATLVGLYFMHLIERPDESRLVPIVSVILVAVLVTLTAADIATRHTFPAGP